MSHANPEVAPASVCKPAIIKSDWAGLLPEQSMVALCGHPVLLALSGANPNLPLLRLLLAQHQIYSRNFTRFLCAMMANLPEADDVRRVGENLLEELGADQPQGQSHAELFIASMRAVGVAPDRASPLRGTRALTAAMFGYCRNPDPLEGLAALCLGAEAIVPELYGPILQAMTTLAMPAEARRFFEIHVAGDEDHALVMLTIILRLIGKDAAKAERARAIGVDLIACRSRFLDDVWAGAHGASKAA